jgi:outer membrane protein assembly factor BamB
VNDCATLRFSGSESDFCDDGFYDYIPSDPCEGIYAPQGEDGGSPNPQANRGMGPMGLSSGSVDIRPTIRILKLVAGLLPDTHTGDPNLLLYNANLYPPEQVNNGYFSLYPPLTEQDFSVSELSDTRFWMAPKPLSGPGSNRLDPTWRSTTIADAIRSITIPFSGPDNAIWSMSFLGNALDTGGSAANAVAMPAIADIDGDGKLDAVFPMGTINGRNYPDPWWLDIGGVKSSNPSKVYAISWDGSIQDYNLKPGWPQPLRDAPLGVALANVTGGPNLEVIATNSQDSYAKQDYSSNPPSYLYSPTYLQLCSRPYVWDYQGGSTSVFASSAYPDRGTDNATLTIDPIYPRGVVKGHTAAPPPVWDINGDGIQEIITAGEGNYDTNTGAKFFSTIQGVRATDGSKAFETQSTDSNQLWYTGETPTPPLSQRDPFDTAFYAGVTLVRSDPANSASPRFIVAPATSGRVYAFRTDTGNVGRPLTGFPFLAEVPPGDPNELPAAIYNPVVAADLDGVQGIGNQLHSEIVVSTGDYLNYNADSLPHYNDGVIYCLNDNGTVKWRYPVLHNPQLPTDWLPAIESGVAVGHVNGPNNPPCVVAVDASGIVVALNGATGVPVWTYQLEEQPQHLYFHGAVIQPLIADLNGDGYQEVIIGTTAGYVYVLNGNPSASPRRMWKTHTFLSADSVWRPSGEQGMSDYVVEKQYEEIRGLALAPLNPETPSHAMLLVTCSRAGDTVEIQQVGGHALLFDLSTCLNPGNPGTTWYPAAVDWPQYQCSERRLGFYPAQ